MAFEFKLPDVGEGVVEGEIVRWLVKEGDVVKADQGLIEIMTDKATVVIPSPRAGRVSKTVGKEGEVIFVGKTFVVIEEGNGKPAASPPPAAAAKSAPPPAPAAAAKPAPAPAPAAPQAVAAPAPAAAASARDVLATPATRRLAREMGVDLTRVAPTGPRGRVTHDDVRRLADGGAAAAGAPRDAAPSSGSTALPLEERLPLRGLRKKIAEKMVKSQFTAPHYTYVEEVDVTDLIRIRAEAQKLAEEKGVKLTYLPYIIKALIAGLRRYPLVNSSLDDATGEIVLKRYYHVGIATATDKGLMVPVLRDADKRSLLDLAKEIERLARGAREGTLKPDEVAGSTFSITNLGPLGGVLATPIINHPEVAIMGIHKIRRRPLYRGDELVPRELMNVSVSFDHRVVDGAVGAEFTQYVLRYLENPNLLFMEMV